MTPAEVQVLQENQRRAYARSGARPGFSLDLFSQKMAEAIERACTALVLPYPPSANSLYRTIVRGNRAFPIKSAEHRTYFEAVAARVGHLEPMTGPLEVELRLYRPRKVGDIDGPIKACLDALNGLAWVDDKQICKLVVVRGDDKVSPRVEVNVTRYTGG